MIPGQFGSMAARRGGIGGVNGGESQKTPLSSRLFINYLALIYQATVSYKIHTRKMSNKIVKQHRQVATFKHLDT